ncbi:C39 family peptidase [Methylomagnum sp.]
MPKNSSGIPFSLNPAMAWIIPFLIIMAGPVYPDGRKPVQSLLEMRRDHVVVQQFDISCGAAALATLLNYQHGDMIGEKEVAKGLMRRDEYVKNPGLVQIRQGFSLLDLKRYVDQRGYEGTGFGKLTLADLIAKAPIMVALNMHGYNHFVVFRGLKGDRVLLADPAWGNRTMRVERFEEVWIDYPRIGKVGFVVSRKDGVPPLSELAPRDRDFVMLQ